MQQSKKVCIIGLGYIGLPVATLLANCGYTVHGVDVVPNTVDTINRGETCIAEPGLSASVQSAVNSGKLKADFKPTEADVFIISVPTPFHEGFVPNIDYVVFATKTIIPYVKEGDIVILESTSPVGTTDKVEEILKKEGVDTSKLHIAYCPERVLPGRILIELVENDRIVGGITPEATEVIVEFYKTFVDGEVLSTDAKTAEMVKLIENSFRDTNIAFANELSILCEKFNIDVWELIALANHHPRVNILQPGAGVGGHCIAVDPWFLVYAGGDDAKMIRTAREVNTYKTEWVIEKIKNAALKFENENGQKAKVACMGLAYKADIDDFRESPALYITQRLAQELDNVVACEPNIPLDFKHSKLNNTLSENTGGMQNSTFKLVDLNQIIESADVITFLVAHKEFYNLEIETDLDFCGVINGNI